MSVLLVIWVFAAGLAVAVVKGLLGKEVEGRLKRRIEASVEATISSLPDALRAEYAEEWRAELAATIAMPLTAATFARGLRRSATLLVGEAEPAAAGARRSRAGAPVRRRRGARGRAMVRLVLAVRRVSMNKLGLQSVPAIGVAAIGLGIGVGATPFAGVLGVGEAVAAVVLLCAGIVCIFGLDWLIGRARERSR